MARNDLLLNGALGEPYTLFRGDKSLQTAVGWAPWWLAAGAHEPDWQKRQPAYGALTLDNTPVQQVSTPWGTHVAGLCQQVPTAVGNQYELTVEGQAWSSEDSTPASQLEASDVNLQIGIDPTGGLDPESPLVLWSGKAQPLSRWQTLRLTVEAQAVIMTVFLKSAPNLPKRQQSIFWRNAFLRPIGPHKRSLNIVGVGDTHIALQPDQPQPGQSVTVLVSSTRAHAQADLWVLWPEGEATAVTFQGTTKDEERTVWRYLFLAEAVGLYEIRFVSDDGARLLALRLLRVEREVQLVPSTARTTYRRVYVLLPPTADQKWLLAAARGCFDGRFTVGFSADDAGMGEFAERYVLAVNPHHWPDVLTTHWFRQHYPGVNFTAVVANAPEDLEAWLKNWTP